MADINSHGTEAAEAIYRQIGGKDSPNLAFSGRLLATGNTKAARLSLMGNNADIPIEQDQKLELRDKIKGVFNNFTGDLYNQTYKGLINYTKGLALTGQEVDADEILTDTIGTSVRYNNKQTILPYGVDQNSFEEWLDNIEIPDRPKLTEGIQDITDNFFSGEYQLHYAGNGEYLVWNENNGNGYYAATEDDETKPFILKWGE
jgi:hypothetical protein